MPEPRTVREECTAWTTAKNRKTKAIGSDANARPVILQRGTTVAVNGVLLGVEPRSLLVEVNGELLELREKFLAPAG
ncbi:MAG: hypothetical protein KIS78_03095 [Labilithrix sp.]|nr:hypothetical protein [Labilithrix sp.]MCW5831429.1 hypothetical protein [Labilithrix sp.]